MFNLKEISRNATVDTRLRKCVLCKGAGTSKSEDDTRSLPRLSNILIDRFNCDEASVICFGALYTASPQRRLQAIQIVDDLRRRKDRGDVSRSQRLKGNT